MFSSLPIWLLMCRSCSTFSTISSSFPVIERSERCIFNIQISILKTLEPTLCHTYWYCIMFINITNFFSSLSRIFPFFVIKFQNISNFFFIFTHFQDAITFDWINKYHNFFFLITLWYVTFQKHANIARSH